MKSLAIALVLGSAAAVHAQASGNSPAAPVNPDQLFQSPLLQPPGKPQFKWQYPDASHRFFILQTPDVGIRVKPSINQDIDPEILRKPRGFSQYPSRPAPHGNLYPGLKIQPTEIAKLEGISIYPRLGAEPIPRVFPKAKIEYIPITWGEFRLAPAGDGVSPNP
jgi:hypothetical protein